MNQLVTARSPGKTTAISSLLPKKPQGTKLLPFLIQIAIRQNAGTFPRLDANNLPF